MRSAGYFISTVVVLVSGCAAGGSASDDDNADTSSSIDDDGDGGDDGMPMDLGWCENFIDCAREATPEAVSGIIATYGQGGECWALEGTTFDDCSNECRANLENVRMAFPGIVACQECQADPDCPAGDVCSSDSLCVAPSSGACNGDADCPDGYCVGGVCGECRSDSDCTELPYCSGSVGGSPSLCLGSICSADGDCSEKSTCEGVRFGPGGSLIDSACSSCGSDTVCPEGLTCGVLEVSSDTGGIYRACRPIGEAPAGEICAPDSQGDAHCASGSCEESISGGFFRCG